MIEAKELRIGNLVTDEFYDSCKTIIEVDSISDRGINLFIEDDGNYPECAQTWIEPEKRFNTIFGIPLTEEWLLKFGFSKNENDVLQIETTLMPLSITLNDNYPNEKYKAWVYEDEKSRYHIISNNIKHVHQLQNLYHALTNEELTLTKQIMKPKDYCTCDFPIIRNGEYCGICEKDIESKEFCNHYFIPFKIKSKKGLTCVTCGTDIIN